MTELGFKIPADLAPGALAPNSDNLLHLSLFELIFKNWEISYQNLESWLILTDRKNWGHGCIPLRLMPMQAGPLDPVSSLSPPFVSVLTLSSYALDPIPMPICTYRCFHFQPLSSGPTIFVGMNIYESVKHLSFKVFPLYFPCAVTVVCRDPALLWGFELYLAPGSSLITALSPPPPSSLIVRGDVGNWSRRNCCTEGTKCEKVSLPAQVCFCLCTEWTGVEHSRISGTVCLMRHRPERVILKERRKIRQRFKKCNRYLV